MAIALVRLDLVDQLSSLTNLFIEILQPLSVHFEEDKDAVLFVWILVPRASR